MAGLLPAVASLAAWGLAMNAGLVPVCNPFLDGCVSISRAARHELPNHVFRALMLPARALRRWRALHVARMHERALLVLLTLIVALGLGNVLAGLWADAAPKDRIENATEWWGALGLTPGFVVVALPWRRWDLSAQLTTSGSAAPPDR